MLLKHRSTGQARLTRTLGGSATNPAHVIYQVVPRDADRYFGLKLQYKFGN